MGFILTLLSSSPLVHPQPELNSQTQRSSSTVLLTLCRQLDGFALLQAACGDSARPVREQAWRGLATVQDRLLSTTSEVNGDTSAPELAPASHSVENATYMSSVRSALAALAPNEIEAQITKHSSHATYGSQIGEFPSADSLECTLGCY